MSSSLRKLLAVVLSGDCSLSFRDDVEGGGRRLKSR